MVTLYVVFSVLLFCIALFLFLSFPSLRRHKDREVLQSLYIAHRGFHSLEHGVPENSIAAFEKAIEKGYAIEIDIHLTADGHVVVFHDSDLKRVCNVDGVIEDKTLAEIKQLRLFDTDCQIPTLKECLDVVDGCVPLLIEFKCTSVKCAQLCQAANEILSQYKGKYFIQSFYPTVLQWYKKYRKDILRGQLSTKFKGEGVSKSLLGRFLFNFLGRPDFVSYEHKYHNYFFFRLNVKLGAMPIGWTFENIEQLEVDKEPFEAYIFEGFSPKK